MVLRAAGFADPNHRADQTNRRAELPQGFLGCEGGEQGRNITRDAREKKRKIKSLKTCFSSP